MATFPLTINNEQQLVDVGPATPLLWGLRDHLKLVGTKYGCGTAQYKACTIYLDGTAVRSCQLPVSAVGDQAVTTIEDLSKNGDHTVQIALI